MIRTTEQLWEVGEIVKVGFMKLRILAKVPTPGDFAPDAYVLGSTSGAIYRFVPHHGLQRFATLEQAMQS